MITPDAGALGPGRMLPTESRQGLHTRPGDDLFAPIAATFRCFRVQILAVGGKKTGN